ncbi:MAG TPA: succinate dehydrogenase [Patescibacteria group bacterium]|jgi:succinate dehydrogenase / fumarate reductase membrane anchor subunit|nr:succinate dehydrogenase [Patescibacteria group bacterium]
MATTRQIKRRNNFESYAFLFMRLSGVLLLLFAVGHMMIQHVLRDVHSLTLQVVQDIWRSWGWRAYDLLLLIFAIIHGFNGLRQVLQDYIHKPGTLKAVSYALVVLAVVTIIWSAVAIFTFNPGAVMASAN